MFARVAYVTYGGDVTDSDLPLALSALRASRLEAEAVVWDDVVDWGDFDLVVVRSVWDHVARRPEFLRWARAVEEQTRLANPAQVLARNTDKSYLRDFSRAGIPTIPTIWFEPGDSPQGCITLIQEAGWQRVVVKPNVDGDRFRTGIWDTAEEASAAADSLARSGRTALLQPYLSVVEQSAEISVVVLGGEISHAITRRPALTSGDDSAAESVQPPTAVRDLVSEILPLAADGDDLLYARVDVVPDGEEWLLMQFEATAPRLFLDSTGQAASRFAGAVRRWLRED